MDFLSHHNLHASTTDAGREFDDLFSRSSTSRDTTDNEPYASPSDLSIKKQLQGPDHLKQGHVLSIESPSDSPVENSSPGSSLDSLRDHGRNSSVASMSSAVHSEGATKYQSDGWLGSEMLSGKENVYFGLDTDMHTLDRVFSMDTDIESSNRVMDSAFDFESAASSPSPLKTDAASALKSQKPFKMQIRSPSNSANHFARPKVSCPVSWAVFCSFPSNEA
jgi:hypothetical protein